MSDARAWQRYVEQLTEYQVAEEDSERARLAGALGAQLVEGGSLIPIMRLPRIFLRRDDLVTSQARRSRLATQLEDLP